MFKKPRITVFEKIAAVTAPSHPLVKKNPLFTLSGGYISDMSITSVVTCEIV